MIGFRDLECLLVLLEELHLPPAAERLGITQSALARTIRRLETELDVPLVTRQSPSVTPTDAGRRFGEHVRPLLGGLQLAVAEARRLSGVIAPLRIGCVPDLHLQSLQAFLGALHLERPRLQVDVIQWNARSLRLKRTIRADSPIRLSEYASILVVRPGDVVESILQADDGRGRREYVRWRAQTRTSTSSVRRPEGCPVQPSPVTRRRGHRVGGRSRRVCYGMRGWHRPSAEPGPVSGLVQ